MKKRKNFNYLSAIKYIAIFTIVYLFCFVVPKAPVLAVAPFSAAICLGANAVALSVILLSATVLSGNIGLLASFSIVALFFVIVSFVYKKLEAEIKGEIAGFTAISLLGYIFLGNLTNNDVAVDSRILYSVITVGTTLLLWISGGVTAKKGLKFKPSGEEVLTVAASAVLIGIGICNAISPLFFKSLALFTVLLFCYVYRLGIGCLVSSVLGISLAVYYKNVNFISLLLIWGIFASAFTPYSKYLAVTVTVLADYAAQALFGVYGAYSLSDAVFMIAGGVCYLVIPSRFLALLKEKLYRFREKQLVKKTINRNRTTVSDKLFELSGVFSEMAAAFNALKNLNGERGQVKTAIVQKTVETACTDCENAAKCNRKQEELIGILSSLTEMGLAKGKLSFIDLPKNFLSVCIHPNNILYAINKLLFAERENSVRESNALSGREIIAEQAEGVSSLLRTLAIESGTQLGFSDKTERTLSNALYKKGYDVNEILVYGEGERTSVGMILTMKEVPVSALTRTVSEILSIEMTLTERTEISTDKCYFSFAPSAKYDAVFGLAAATKDGSTASGDTHSVTRLTGDRFLVALSDGMGSGNKARTVSSVSLSLIESFYKAGVESELILGTVNKLLSVNTEDSFTALDVSVIDLRSCTADFIKYGAPYGFIVGEEGIRIVESSSLPLGILNELKPSCCRATINNGDTLVLLTDGISDAFGSSSEIVEFLRSIPVLNPQSLADDLLKRAISLSGGEKKDDMTVLCVRVFSKNRRLVG